MQFLSRRVPTAEALSLAPGTEAAWIEKIVRSQIIDNWKAQDNPEHLRTIRNRLLAQEQKAWTVTGVVSADFGTGWDRP